MCKICIAETWPHIEEIQMSQWRNAKNAKDDSGAIKNVFLFFPFFIVFYIFKI